MNTLEATAQEIVTVDFDKLDFTLPIQSLHFLLNSVQGAIGTGATAEVLTHVLIEAKDDKVAFITSNAESNAIAVTSEVEVSSEGIVLVPMKTIQKIAAVAGETVSFIRSAKGCQIKSDGSVWVENVLDPEVFPDVPVIGDSAIQVPTKQLFDALQFVSPAIAKDDNRPSLMVVYFGSDGAYASSGNRVHFFAFPTGPLEGYHFPASAVRPIMALLRITPSDYVFVEVRDQFLLMAIGPNQFHVRLLDLEFPDFRNTVLNQKNQSNTKIIEVPTFRFDTALKRASFISDTISISIKSNGIMVIGAVGKSGSQSVTSVEPLKVDQFERNASFDLGILMDLVSVMQSETMELRFSTLSADGTMYLNSGSVEAVLLPKVRGSDA